MPTASSHALWLLLPLVAHAAPSSHASGTHHTHSKGVQETCSSFHREYVGACRCSCVIVDVGLNNGDSLLTWAPEAVSYEVDSHEAKGIDAWPERRERLRQCMQDNSTCYYGFEANPIFDEQLGALQTRLRSWGRPVKLFTSTAFNVHDQPAEFLAEPKAKYGSRSGNVGSTLEKDKSMVFVDKSGVWRHNHNHTVKERYEKRIVKSSNASAFLSQLAANTDFIALKLDIEGFEYTLLPYLLLHNPRALCALQVMAIEWHENMVPKYAGNTAHLLYFLKHSFCNMSILNWH